MTERYIVVEGSETGHCCFDATVVDTAKSLTQRRFGKHYNNAYDPICECLDRDDAVQIAAALNRMEDKTNVL